MTRRLVGWLVLLPLCLIIAVFALANRHVVSVRFDPLPLGSPLVPPVEVPLFVVIYAVLIVGIVLGGIATWFAQGRQRREKRQWRRRATELEKAQATRRDHSGLHPDRPQLEGP